MLTGLPPFYSRDREKLYKNIKFADPKLDHAYLSAPARDLLKRLLDKNPATRLGSSEKDALEIREHQWFENINWDALTAKQVTPPYRPILEVPNDLKHFPKEFTELQMSL